MRITALALVLAACVMAGNRVAMSTTQSPQWLRAIVKRQFQPAGPQAVRRALCIVGRESQWNPRAVSSTGDYGLFQINYSSWGRSFDWSRIKEPVYNTWVAWRLSSHGRDFGPWSGGRYAC